MEMVSLSKFGFEGYCVTKDGRIWSNKRNKFLKKHTMKTGHVFVELHCGKKHVKKVAELVLKSFTLVNCDDNTQIVFKDGNYHNIHLNNLEWGSTQIKRCTKCKKYKNKSEFSKRCGQILDIYCKDCTSKIAGYKRRFKEKPIFLSDIQKGYLAGFIDGEGCIFLRKAKSKKSNDTFVAGISIGNTNVSELTNLQKEVGLGYLYIRPNKNPKHKVAAIWQINANGCRAILKNILPYLRIKKRQAILLLDYLELAKKANQRAFRQEYFKKVQNIYLEIRKLNQKGKS